MTGAKLTSFAQSLLREWRRLELPSQANVIVAVSGGADSVALFLALHELINAKKLELILTVAHVDHRLRKVSGADARWVKDLAGSWGYQFSIRRVDVNELVNQSGDNLEQAARVARYRQLSAIAQKLRASIVLTGHTMDDQAETVLFNLLRGSGLDGLGGIEPVRAIEEGSKTLLVRPLLAWARRQATAAYCAEQKVAVRQDEMNTDETFSRVRIRRQLIPLMESFNPKVVDAIVRAGDLLRDDSEALESAAARLLEFSAEGSGASRGTDLRLDLLASAPPALRRRALRRWLGICRGDLRRLERVHIAAVETLLVGDHGGRVIELPGGAKVSRSRGLLSFTKGPRTSARAKT